ncbi:MAG: redoxin domain-containing protein [Candidatus Nanohaloarchaea archaeon]
MVFQGAEAPGFEGEWLNTCGVEKNEGVILVDFWSLSCPECQSKTAEMQELHAERQLKVVGVHAQEFGFEHENLEEHVDDSGIEYPVLKDHGKKTWRKYGNRKRPRQVIIKDGEVAWKDAGDSRTLSEALKDILELDEEPELRSGGDHTPMKYLGYSKCTGINESGNFRGKRTLEMPQGRRMNEVYLSGTWKQEEDSLEAVKDAELRIKFRASQAETVIHPDGVKKVEVRLDSAPPGEKAGSDVEDGALKAANPGVFNVVNGAEEMQSELVLRPEKGTRLYAVAFRNTDKNFRND